MLQLLQLLAESVALPGEAQEIAEEYRRRYDAQRAECDFVAVYVPEDFELLLGLHCQSLAANLAQVVRGAQSSGDGPEPSAGGDEPK